MGNPTRWLLRDRSVDVLTGEIWMHDGSSPGKLTPTERKCLDYFARHETQLVSRDELLVHVWEHRPGSESRTVFSTVHRLRAKIEKDPKNPVHLFAEYGGSYRFVFKPLAEWAGPTVEHPLAALSVFHSPFTALEAGEILDEDPAALREALDLRFGEPAPSSSGIVYSPLPDPERKALSRGLSAATRARNRAAWEALRVRQVDLLLASPRAPKSRERISELEADLVELAGSESGSVAARAAEALSFADPHTGEERHRAVVAEVAERFAGAPQLQALTALGRLQLRSTPREALSTLTLAHSLAQRIGSPQERRSVALLMTSAHSAIGDYEAAAQIVAPIATLPDATGAELLEYGGALRGAGYLDEALRWGERAVEVAADGRVDATRANRALIGTLHAVGRYEEAYRTAKRTCTENSLQSSPANEQASMILWMLTAATTGRWEEADILMARLRTQVQTSPRRSMFDSACVTLAAARGRWEEVTQWLSLPSVRAPMLEFQDGAQLAVLEALAHIAAKNPLAARERLDPASREKKTLSNEMQVVLAVAAHLLGEPRSVEDIPRSAPPVVEMLGLYEALRTGSSPSPVFDLGARALLEALKTCGAVR